MLGNKDATRLIREELAGKLPEYFTPVAVSCLLLQGEELEFFVDVTKSQDVPKLLTEYLVPIYSAISLSVESR